ncbi:MAG: hypothetical protein QOH65_332 [Methylobacteriaceae bacterium]|jgi:hypothetical protein|nr:hypothetical protein [Methylobacteriaceae bacterium]
MANDARSLSIALICTSPARAWQAALAAALRDAGHSVIRKVEVPAAVAKSAAVELVLEFERLAYGARSQAFALQDAGADETSPGSDITIDLRDLPASQADEIRLVALFDGSPGEAGLIGAMIDGRAPEIVIVRWADQPHVIARGSPIWQNRDVLAYGLDQVLPRTADLLRQCVTRFARGEKMHGPSAEIALKRAPPLPVSFIAKSVTAKLSRRLRTLVVHPEHWTIAFRRLHDDAVIERGTWPDAAWTRVPDDGARYFADPFPFIDHGRTYVFCEEYPYATRKGLISLFEIVDGMPTKPRPILERPYHLSYPFVFRRGSEIYMIPETSAVGRIELYRAERFPERWAFERVLINDVIASDATLVTWRGRDWLFASIADERASTWDSLGLFHANDLFGDWTAHPLNPVLIDAGAARPGGAMVIQGARLRRVAQDCRAMYGGGIVLADVDRLDPENYAQSVRAVLGPPPGSGSAGAHTLNVAGDAEFIDLVGSKRRL